MERTFIAIKPDAVQRGLVGEILSRFEKKGFKLVAMKFVQPSADLAKKHYAEHEGKGFYQGLVDFITSGPVVAMVWEGTGVVASGRKLIGATDPLKSEPGTIRGDFFVQVGRNGVHGSDSVTSAEREIKLWFGDNEIFSWTPTISKWLYE